MSRRRTNMSRNRGRSAKRIETQILGVLLSPIVFARTFAVFVAACIDSFFFSIGSVLLKAARLVVVVGTMEVVRVVAPAVSFFLDVVKALMCFPYYGIKVILSAFKKKPAPAAIPKTYESSYVHVYPATPVNKFSLQWDLDFLSTPPSVEPVREDHAKEQHKHGAQSLRKGVLCGMSGTMQLAIRNPHSALCFEKMVEDEKKMAGEWCVMYHSYSFAAPLYEIHAAVAAILYGYDADNAPLPRLVCEAFKEFQDAKIVCKRLPPNRDHDISWRRAVIAGSTSLYSADPEATPAAVFENGYSCADLSFLTALHDVLVFCGISDYLQVGKDLIKLCSENHMSTAYYGGHGSTGQYGHLLQIFVKRTAVDSLAYASQPFGVVDNTRMPLSAHLASNTRIHGQVRICANPNAFMRSDIVQLRHYCSNQTLFKKRKELQKALQDVLRPHLAGKVAQARAKVCKRGIRPDSEQDQEENAQLKEVVTVDKASKSGFIGATEAAITAAVVASFGLA